MKRNEIKVINGKYEFSQRELEQIADDMASLVQEKEYFEEKRKMIIADLNAKKKEFEIKLSELATCRRDKFQMRDLQCRVEKDVREGIKEYYWTGDGRLIMKKAMTPEEIAKARQISMFPAEAEGAN